MKRNRIAGFDLVRRSLQGLNARHGAAVDLVNDIARLQTRVLAAEIAAARRDQHAVAQTHLAEALKRIVEIAADQHRSAVDASAAMPSLCLRGAGQQDRGKTKENDRE